MKRTQSLIYCLAAGSLLVAGSAAWPSRLQAQSVISLDRSSAFRLVLPTPPKDPRAPQGRQKGGSSRGGSALPSVYPLMALVPATTGPNQEKFVWGLTTAERPVLWFMMPELESAPVEFVLQDEHDRYIHRANFTLPSSFSQGLVQIGLPESMPALAFDKRYTWTLAVAATPRHPTMFVQGTIYRVPLASSLKEPIGQATELEKVAIYAQYGLWHDAIATLAQLRQTYPKNAQVKTAWADLLKQAQLDEIANQPLLPCCTDELLLKNDGKHLRSQD
ncbi:hypothetical protein C1752_01671 [Acaryochloris thomasi RCC1774]|uniref:DUF928 domain-containing protein n=1 Tax=Acaryochloris thomasi RCC1774 TaxID=1764569 RepID=A0A2W1JTE6_9CYAN|nr:DUF928 domain-containing protein [Acaryochloris thomasi]PZD73852.1 hypothetical protein C1752_01671 [Acaryochloris thomasi RCC1774]